MAMIEYTDSTESLVSSLPALWGDWPVFVGVAVALFVRGWQFWRPLALDALPSRLRPLVAIVFAGLPAVSIALLAGEDWIGAAIALLQAFAGAAGTVDALRLVFGKPPSDNGEEQASAG